MRIGEVVAVNLLSTRKSLPVQEKTAKTRRPAMFPLTPGWQSTPVKIPGNLLCRVQQGAQ